MQDKVWRYVKDKHMIERRDKIIVGVSGGADSVCLISLLNSWKKELEIEILAVHVHHGLRGQKADQDEEYTKVLCDKLQIPLIIRRQDVMAESKKRKCSLEEAGRDVRREIFYKVKEENAGTKIALAHHKNDSAETMLMNLARGTGIRGLGGITPVNDDIIRPLLCIERLEIEGYLKEHNIPFQIDETNNSNDYTRNRIRNEIIPSMEEHINSKAVEHMANASVRLEEVQAFLREEIKKYISKSVIKGDKEIVIKDEEYCKMPKVMKSFVIQSILEEMANSRKDIGATHIRDIQKLFDNQVGKKIDLPYEMQAVRCYEGIRIEKKTAQNKERINYNLFDLPEIRIGQKLIRQQVISKEELQGKAKGKPCTKQFDYDIIKGDVIVRTRESGDYIVINEQGNTQKLKDYFINEKIPSEKRDTIWLIADGQHILWIVGYRSSYACKVSEQTKRILEIKIQTDVEDTDERQY